MMVSGWTVFKRRKNRLDRCLTPYISVFTWCTLLRTSWCEFWGYQSHLWDYYVRVDQIYFFFAFPFFFLFFLFKQNRCDSSFLFLFLRIIPLHIKIMMFTRATVEWDFFEVHTAHARERMKIIIIIIKWSLVMPINDPINNIKEKKKKKEQKRRKFFQWWFNKYANFGARNWWRDAKRNATRREIDRKICSFAIK